MEAALEACMAVTAFTIVLAACLTGISLETANIALSQTAESSSLYASKVIHQLALTNLDLPEKWRSLDLDAYLMNLRSSRYSFIELSLKCFFVTPNGEVFLLWEKHAIKGLKHPTPYLGRAFLAVPLRDGSLVVIKCTVG